MKYDTTAMILAAGLGTRLKSLTHDKPKALVELNGKPLLQHCIENLTDNGFHHIVINVHHFADKIRKYLSDNDFGLDMKISDESSELLETGGGIAYARELLLPSEEPFLVHNVDILSNLDIPWFRTCMRPDALATLLVSERQTQRYLLFRPEDMRLVGWTNISTGEVKSPYKDLDPSACLRFAFSGIHNISPSIFGVFDEMGLSGRFPIMDFYLSVCERYPIFGVAVPELKIVDVGKLDSLAQAEKFVTMLPGWTG